jgi:hypothetical protein
MVHLSTFARTHGIKFALGLALVLMLSVALMGTSATVYASGGKGTVQPAYVICSSTTWLTIGYAEGSTAGHNPDSLNYQEVYLYALFDHRYTGTYCGEMQAQGVFHWKSTVGIGSSFTVFLVASQQTRTFPCGGNFPTLCYSTTQVVSTDCGQGLVEFFDPWASPTQYWLGTGTYCP